MGSLTPAEGGMGWDGMAGFPTLGWEWQKTENVALCRALGMPPHLKGVRVTRTEPTATCARSLLTNDVVTAFDGTPIASDGTGGAWGGGRGFIFLGLSIFVLLTVHAWSMTRQQKMR